MLGAGAEQIYIFAVFFVLGVGFSAFYMFFLGLTKTKLAAIIFDSLFGVGAIYAIWKVNLDINNGEFRAFLFVALALGCVTAYLTCKRMLDKLSAMLYNLFTEKLVDKADGKNILQKNNSNIIHSGNTDSGTADLRATDNSRSVVRGKRSHRKVRTALGRGGRHDRRTSTDARVSSNGRLREKMGRRKQSN